MSLPTLYPALCTLRSGVHMLVRMWSGALCTLRSGVHMLVRMWSGDCRLMYVSGNNPIAHTAL